MKFFVLSSLFAMPWVLFANADAWPPARTGDFGEPTCEGSGCHRVAPSEPLNGRVVIDVGPYVPGQKQRIRVVVEDVGAQRWGFQLTARLASNPQRPVGTFSPVNAFVRVKCADGNPQPCANQFEYAGQTGEGSLVASASGAAIFLIDWTAPPDSNGVGDIIFNAAGMGANKDSSPNGDRTYTTKAVSLFAPSNTPTLKSVVNGASFAPSGVISQGVWVTLFGDKLAPPGFRREVTRTDLDATTGKLPIELSRIGADFIVPGMVPVPAYVSFVSDTQLNVQVPALDPAGYQGPLDVQVVFNRGQGANEVRGNRVIANLRSISPALFTFAGSNSAAALTLSYAPIGRVGQFVNSRPARPGEVIQVYGTGYGLTRVPVEPGAAAPGGPDDLAAPVSAQIGGVVLSGADILYAGTAPGFAGLYQFNLRVPASLGSGDFPIVVGVSQTDSQPGVILTVQP